VKQSRPYENERINEHDCGKRIVENVCCARHSSIIATYCYVLAF
jgi:hypothetical protein